MMGTLPQLTIVGNIGNDIEIRTTRTGNAVCNFSIGVTPRTKDASGS